MPDTGLPWEIPYLDGTEFVKDYPQASEDLADAIVDALDGIPVIAGIGSNVVQTVKSNVFTTSSTSFTTITGLEATITPSSDTSRILVLYQVTVGQSTSDGAVSTQLVRGATPLFVGDAAGSRVRASFSAAAVVSRETHSGTVVFLDNPGVDTAVTYSVEIRIGTVGTASVGRSSADSNSANNARTPASITLIEVAV
jgi:hypothetical protein